MLGTLLKIALLPAAVAVDAVMALPETAEGHDAGRRTSSLLNSIDEDLS